MESSLISLGFAGNLLGSSHLSALVYPLGLGHPTDMPHKSLPVLRSFCVIELDRVPVMYVRLEQRVHATTFHGPLGFTAFRI